MEDEKKKRNKKKKNKQTKHAAVTGGGGETAVSDENNVNRGKNVYIEPSETIKVQNGDIVRMDLNIKGHHQPRGTEGSILAEDKKELWMLGEVDSEEPVRRLQYENDSHRETKNMLEETIQCLQNENDLHIHQKAHLEETVTRLQKEVDSHIEKEILLGDTIECLQNENKLQTQQKATLEKSVVKLKNKTDYIAKEVSLEMKLKQLQREEDIWLIKEVNLKEKLQRLEREKDSLIVAENTANETITKQSRDITRLHMQVVELEEFKGNLLQDKQQLLETISSLQFQVEKLEGDVSSARSSNELSKYVSENKDLNAQIDAASALVGKLITENADLVEKVNELTINIEQQKMTARRSSVSERQSFSKLKQTNSTASPMNETHENLSLFSQNPKHVEVVVPIKDERTVIRDVDTNGKTFSSLEAEENSGEIVQIPLSDNEELDLESQAIQTQNNVALPLSDAPLIGAPFRLVSFFARYVSGADLVDKNSG